MITGIIPARYASSRFPGKPLIDIRGKTMIRRVYEQSAASGALSQVVVATDDERIAAHVDAFGGKFVMTSSDHPSGTDRCHEAARLLGITDGYVINIQGDEPFIDPSQIDLLASALDGDTEIATLIIPVKETALLESEGEVKVVLNSRMEALYFSRMTIPYVKGVARSGWNEAFPYYRHVGLYGYRLDVLDRITALPVSSLEQAESLEQLRWLEHGFRIKCAVTHFDSHCIDTPEDVERLIGELSGDE